MYVKVCAIMSFKRHVVELRGFRNKTMWKTRLLTGVAAFAICSFGTVVAGGKTVCADSLEIELRQLIETHPKLTDARNSVSAANQGVKGALGGYYPKVALSSDYGLEYVDSPSRRKDNRESFMMPRETAGITVTQKLFDGFATQATVQTNRLGENAAKLNLEAVRQQALMDGTTAYVNILRQTETLKLARSSEGNIQKVLNLESERVERGAGISVDVLESKRRLQSAKEKRVKYEGDLENARSTYVQIFDRAPEVGSMKDPLPPTALLPASLDEAIAIALRENPEVEGLDNSVQVEREKRRAARAAYYPTLSLEGKANYEDDKNATIGVRRDWSVLLKANWELFSGFSTQAAVAQASYMHASAKDKLDSKKRSVIEETKIAWNNLLTARERVQLLENAVNIATEVWESRKKLREAEKETVINVLDAENEVYSAQINYIDVSYEARLAVYKLMKAMGRLDLDTIERETAQAAPMTTVPFKTN
jgi:adhesin transport system outer membrane protein